MVHQPHDALFRAILGQPAEAAAELRSLLPARQLAVLDLDAIRRLDTRFIDPDLRGSASDLLFAVPRRNGGTTTVLFVMEHQSTPDARMPFRLLQYCARIWERQQRERPPRALLPPIVPVVIHQGPQPWPFSRRFRDSLEGGAVLLDSLSPNVIDFEIVVDDLARQSDQQLLARCMSAISRLTLIALKNGRARADLALHLAGFVTALRHDLRGPGVLPALAQLVRYVLDVGEGAPELVQQTLAAALPPQYRSEVMTTADILRERGRAEGIVVGRRASLIELLELRFGGVSAAGRARIEAAALEQLREWLCRALKAAQERDVFEQ